MQLCIVSRTEKSHFQADFVLIGVTKIVFRLSGLSHNIKRILSELSSNLIGNILLLNDTNRKEVMQKYGEKKTVAGCISL